MLGIGEYDGRVRKTIRLKSKTVKKFFDKIEEDEYGSIELDYITDNGSFEGTVFYEDGTEEEISGEGMWPGYMDGAMEIIQGHVDKFYEEFYRTYRKETM